MATRYKISVLSLGFAISYALQAQSHSSAGGKLEGVWQEKTPIVNSAYLARYTINADTCWYYVNEYDGLNPIRAFGGTYTADDDTIKLKIQYIKRIPYTDICRDQFAPANNQWSILDGGKLVTDTLPVPLLFALPVKIDSTTLVVDDVPFYLVTDGQQ